MRRFPFFFVFWLSCPVHAWVLPHSHVRRDGRDAILAEGFATHRTRTTATSPFFTRLKASGFGGGTSKASKASKKTKVNKLKPKAQWDRFLDMKGAARIRVAVSSSATSSADESDVWMEVGHVKSKDDAYTALAVARQRALIVDHANRLYPLKISPKKPVQWAYWSDDASAWTAVDKAILDNENDDSVPENLEKIIGFEGKPDPNSGYYCVYNEGRLVNDSETARPSSKKLK